MDYLLGGSCNLIEYVLACLKNVDLKIIIYRDSTGFPGGSEVKVSASNGEAWVQSLGREDPLEKEMATHSSILAWRIPRTEEPGRLQSTGSQRVGHG